MPKQEDVKEKRINEMDKSKKEVPKPQGGWCSKNQAIRRLSSRKSTKQDTEAISKTVSDMKLSTKTDSVTPLTCDVPIINEMPDSGDVEKENTEYAKPNLESSSESSKSSDSNSIPEEEVNNPKFWKKYWFTLTLNNAR